MSRSVLPVTLTAEHDAPTVSRSARWLALGAVVGPVLFDVAWVVLGLVSRGYTLFDHTFTHYSPISQSISGLGMGSTAPFMNAAFIVSGLVTMVGAYGVLATTTAVGRTTARRVCAALLGLTGVGQVIDGTFHLDAWLPHTIGFLFAMGTPVISFLVAGFYFRRIRRWRRFGTRLLLGSPLTLLLVVAYFMTFQPTADGAEHGIAGLVQRIGVIEVHSWFAAMGLLAFRRR